MAKAKYLREAQGRLKKAQKELTPENCCEVVREVIDVLLFLIKRG